MVRGPFCHPCTCSGVATACRAQQTFRYPSLPLGKQVDNGPLVHKGLWLATGLAHTATQALIYTKLNGIAAFTLFEISCDAVTSLSWRRMVSGDIDFHAKGQALADLWEPARKDRRSQSQFCCWVLLLDMAGKQKRFFDRLDGNDSCTSWRTPRIGSSKGDITRLFVKSKRNSRLCCAY